MRSNSGYPQLTTEQMSQLLSSIQQSQPGLLQQVLQINRPVPKSSLKLLFLYTLES